MQKIKIIAGVAVPFIVLLLLYVLFVAGSDKQIQKEIECGLDTGVDTLNCNINKQENKVLSLDDIYKAKVTKADKVVQEASGAFNDLQIAKQNLLIMYEMKRKVMSKVSSSFPSELVHSQN